MTDPDILPDIATMLREVARCARRRLDNTHGESCRLKASVMQAREQAAVDFLAGAWTLAAVLFGDRHLHTKAIAGLTRDVAAADFNGGGYVALCKVANAKGT